MELTGFVLNTADGWRGACFEDVASSRSMAYTFPLELPSNKDPFDFTEIEDLEDFTHAPTRPPES